MYNMVQFFPSCQHFTSSQSTLQSDKCLRSIKSTKLPCTGYSRRTEVQLKDTLEMGPGRSSPDTMESGHPWKMLLISLREGDEASQVEQLTNILGSVTEKAQYQSSGHIYSMYGIHQPRLLGVLVPIGSDGNAPSFDKS